MILNYNPKTLQNTQLEVPNHPKCDPLLTRAIQVRRVLSQKMILQKMETNNTESIKELPKANSRTNYKNPRTKLNKRNPIKINKNNSETKES